MLKVAAPLFSEEGVEAEIISTGSTIGAYAAELKNSGYALHHIPFSKSPSFFLELLRFIRSRQYDVIHLHTERANFWIGLVALAARPRRVLRTIHSNFLFKGNLRFRRSLQRRILNRLGVAHVSIGPSVHDNELANHKLKTTVVPNWYDDSRFVHTSETDKTLAREALGISGDRAVIVTVGNCSEVKNHQSLLRAMALLPNDVRPIYLHAGREEPGSPEQHLAEQLGITQDVRFLGAVSDIRPLLQAADVFIMPSLYEGFGIAAVEALATGSLCIFSKVPGLVDLERDYPGLCYVSPTDEMELSMALARMLALGGHDRQEKAIRYSEITRELYCRARGVGGYLEIYRRP